MNRFIKKVLTILLLILVGVPLLLLLFQGRIIYHPRGYDAALLRGVEAEPLRYTTSQGTQVAWLNPAHLTDPECVWLVFCGNGSVALDFAGYFHPLALKGDCFVLFDYPSYGQSEGRPSPGSIRESIQAVVPAVAARMGLTVDALRPRLRVFGHSLGCAAALMAMEEHGIGKGVLIAPFTRMLDMSRLVMGWPLCELLHHRFDNVVALNHLKDRGGAQLQVFHGTADEVVPFRMGQALADQFPGIIRFHAVKEGRHNDIIDSEQTAILASLAEMR